MIEKTTKKIKLMHERKNILQDRQKSNDDKRRKPLEFNEGDHLLLKVSPITSVDRALKSIELSPKFIGLNQILERIGSIW